MEIDDFPSAAICKLCGNACTLPEEGVDGNLPRVLFCAHTYCTDCLQSIECDSVIQCPECEVKSTLGEGGVLGLNEDDRIIGLIYATKMNKMKSCKSKRRRPKQWATSPKSDTSAVDVEQNIEKVVDVALAEAAKKLSQLKHISEVKRETARLEREIQQASDKAIHAVKKWRDAQIGQLTKLESHFTPKQALSQVQERISTLEIAMRMAREVRSIPSLTQYYTLDKVLETLQAPVVEQSLELKCIPPDSGKSCIFQSEELNQSLALSLKFQLDEPKLVSDTPSKSCQQDFNSKSLRTSPEYSNVSCIPPREKELPSPQSRDQESLGETSDLSPATSPIARPHWKHSVIPHNLASDTGNPDIIIEEIIDDRPEQVLPPTGPELANNWRIHKMKKKQFSCNTRNVTQWVVVTHIVNPNHFYVQYVAEKKEIEILSKKINGLCLADGSRFTSSDTVEIGSLIFAKRTNGLWGRASVVGISPTDCAVGVSACVVTQLSALRVLFLDYGLTKSITIQSKESPAESALVVVNSHLRKVSQVVNVELGRFTHQAVKCSLKNLVPYDLAKGWSKEAEDEFCRIVGGSAVEMHPLGEDRDSLLVDLRKAPMDQSSDVPFSVREYLVFIEVARLFTPVTLGLKPLVYYPPVHPKINRELSAVVSHVNSPADFYIQLADSMESWLLSTKLQDCYNAAVISGEEELNIYCPVIGQACVSRLDDGKWYRAHVIGHLGGRKVEVSFVDFGYKATVSVSDLRKIKEEFFALPSMAIHCSLSDVVPVQGTTWSDACTNNFILLAHQKMVNVVATAKAPKGEPLPVKLFEGGLNEPLTNIAVYLVNEELACFKEGLNSNNIKPLSDDLDIWDTPIELGSTVRDIDVPNPKNSAQQQEFDPQLKMLTQRKDLEVRVTHINSPSSFYVQFMQNDSQLQRICEQVEQACVLSGPQDVTWNVGMFCAAHIKGVWERGQICNDVTSSNTAEVRRCDHGDTVKVHISDLRPLPSSLIGSVALECTLDDIRPAGGRSTWTDTARDLFSHYVTRVSLTLTIKELTDECPIPVTLFGCNGQGRFINISDFLTKEGLALKKRKPSDAVIQQDQKTDTASSGSETQNDTEGKGCSTPASDVSALVCATPRYRFMMSAQKIKTSSYHPPELPCLGLLQMNVSAVGDDGLIYARTQCAEVQLQQLEERIQQSLKTLPRQKDYTWKLVLGCAVIGPDMLWYRGQLLEVLGGNVTVQYVDYGLVENIPVVHLYPVLLCEDVPQLCLPCELLGINPVGGKWQKDALALLKEMLVNRSVDVHVVELPADPKGPLTVEIFIDGLSLNKILCHYEHARIDNTVSAQKVLSATRLAPVLHDWDFSTEGLLEPEEPMLGQFIDINLPEENNFEIRVKHLHTPNELFVWPAEEAIDLVIDGETLDEALTRVNAKINSQPFLTDFPFEGPCLAEYSDGKYYRAKLINITGVEPVTILVQHVDFGSYDTLPTSKLRQIPAELLKFPSRALKVKVAGFKASSVNAQYDVLPYSPDWSVKATMDMMELLHENITATVVAREPQLTVELYNEDEELVHLPLVSSGLAEFD